MSEFKNKILPSFQELNVFIDKLINKTNSYEIIINDYKSSYNELSERFIDFETNNKIKLDDFELKILELEDQNSNLIESLEKLNTTISEKDGQITNFQSLLENSISDSQIIESYVKKISDLEQSLKLVNREVEDFNFSKQELKHKNLELVKLQEVIEKLKDKNSLLESQLLVKNNEFVSLDKNFAELNAKFNEIDKNTKSDEIENLVSQNKIEEYESDILNFKKEVELLNAKYIEKKEQYNFALNELNNKIFSLTEQNKDLLSKIEQSKKNYEKINEILITERKKIFELEKNHYELDTYKKLITIKDKKIEELESSSQKNEELIDHYKNNEAKFQNRINELISQNEGLKFSKSFENSSLVGLEKENQALKDKLEKTEVILKEIINQNEEKDKQLRIVNDNYNIDFYGSEIDNLNRENEKLKSNILELEKNYQILNENLEKNSNLDKKIIDLEDINKQKDFEIKNLENVILNKNELIENLNIKFNKFNTDAGKNELVKKIDKMIEEFEKLVN